MDLYSPSDIIGGVAVGRPWTRLATGFRLHICGGSLSVFVGALALGCIGQSGTGRAGGAHFLRRDHRAIVNAFTLGLGGLLDCFLANLPIFVASWVSWL